MVRSYIWYSAIQMFRRMDQINFLRRRLELEEPRLLAVDLITITFISSNNQAIFQA